MDKICSRLDFLVLRRRKIQLRICRSEDQWYCGNKSKKANYELWYLDDEILGTLALKFIEISSNSKKYEPKIVNSTMDN